MSSWIAWFDGACPAGVPTYGFIVRRGDEVMRTDGGPVDLLSEEATMNVGEYGGLVEALACLSRSVEPGDQVDVRGDSQLVIYQMQGRYRIKKEHLRPYAKRAWELIDKMQKLGAHVVLTWVPREQNKEADALSKGKVGK